MTRPDDLAPLFQAMAADGQVEFRQGIIVTWDAATGHNSVDVGGAILQDLPCLNIGDFVVLNPGDVVGINKVGNTYFIVGRIQLPAPPDDTRSILDFDIQDESDDDFGMNSTFTTRITINIPLPTWIRPGDEIAIGATFTVAARNSQPTARLYATIVFEYGGVAFNVPAKFADVPSLTFGQTVAVGSLNIGGWGSISSGDSIVVKGQSACTGAAWGADALNGCALLTHAMFRRTQ